VKQDDWCVFASGVFVIVESAKQWPGAHFSKLFHLLKNNNIRAVTGGLFLQERGFTVGIEFLLAHEQSEWLTSNKF